MFWYNCKCFELRGGDEHHNLEVDQYSLGTDEHGKYIKFIERSVKNYQGGLLHRYVQNKNLHVYSQPELGSRCIVDLFSKNLSLIPSSGPFYRRPIQNSNPPKFSQQVIGHNKLDNIVHDSCEAASFSGNYTDHSGKVTCATSLFQSGIDEQLIKHQNGHRSDAVRAYKRSCLDQDAMVSKILQPPAPKKRLSLKQTKKSWQR